MHLRTKNLFKNFLAVLLAAACLLPAAVFAAAEIPTIGWLGGVFGEATLAQIIIRIIQLFLAVLGFIALVFLIYAGFIWMTASGDPDKVLKAKRTIAQVIIGLVIITSAYAITAFIYSRFAPAGTGGEGGTGGCVGSECGGGFDYYTNFPPEITYIDPAVDVQGNTNRQRLVATETADDVSNGAPGNLITIIGRYFGSTAGKVYFVDRTNNSRTLAAVAPCTNAWTGNQIIVVVPSSLNQINVSQEAAVALANPLRNYDIIVEKNSATAGVMQSNPWGFQVNRLDRPGICSVVPSRGVYPATTTISGFKFPLSAPRNIVWKVSPYAATSTGSNWSSSSAVDVVPDGLEGRALVSIYNGVSYSNSYLFQISSGRLNTPCGFDTGSCREDLTTCVGDANLTCQYCSTDPAQPNYQENCNTLKNCTCQPKTSDACAYNSDPNLNAKRACSTGGCDGFEYCSVKGTWSHICQPTNSACIPFLGSSSKIASFSWAFNALKHLAPGMSCVSEIWRDGSCDINGCLTADLACDPESSSEEWIEIYNPTNSTVDLNNWTISYTNNYTGGEEVYLSLNGKSIAGKAYLVVANPSLRLPTIAGSIILNNPINQTDLVSYGVDNLSAAFSPASFGRRIDGSDTNQAIDFVYWPNSSAGLPNNQQAASSTDHLVINEVSLAHDACTCVPKRQLCVAGKVDNQSCPDLGQCQQARTCLETGHWGACVQTNPSCIPYPLVPASTIASYSWVFGVNANAADSGPQVVSACDGSIDCSKNRLPSPSPWDKWTAASAPNVANEEACLNAEIYARFTQLMDSASLNTNNIRLFAYNPANNFWEDKTSEYISDVQAQLSAGDSGRDSFSLKLSRNLAPSTNYRIYLSKKIRDELGRNLLDNPVGVRQELCNENTANGLPAEAGVCWSFRTRPAGNDSICQIGCVNCSPNGYFNRYYGEEKEHIVHPISIDNSCIMLNNRDYAWDWSEEEQRPGGGNWFIQNDINSAYSWLTDPLAGASGIASQPASTITTGLSTTTALQESQWRTSADYYTWFSADDVDYFRINGRVQATGHYGVCAAHNNFTDPVVIENQYCTKSDELNKQILQSPSPWKGQTGVCTNAAIFVLFSRNMQNASLLNNDGTVKNFEIYKCLTAAAATSSSFVNRADNCSLQSGWTAKVFNYTHQNITLDFLTKAAASVNGGLLPEGIEIYPPQKATLSTNTWYKIVIKGGYNGARGGTILEAPEGVLRVPSANARLINGAETWYYWYFQTGAEVCPIDQVAVLPQLKFMETVGETQNYLADPYAANCNHLNPNSYVWKWDSLINPYLDRCSASPTSGDYIATICSANDTNCPTPTEPNLAEVKVFSQSEGDTKITAAADQSGKTCSDRKWGAGDLQVGYGGFKVVSRENSNCLNTEININFSQDATSVSFNDNLQLYKCETTECLTVKSSDLEAIKFFDPEGLPGSNPNPEFTNRAYIAASNNLLAGTTYRVVIKGGDAGVKSFVGSQLTGLNYSLSGNSGGEACDPSVYPWRAGDPDAGKCASNCIFATAADLCGTKSEECSKNSIGCNDLCHKIGNTNFASCGNNQIETGEDCDDGNIKSGDGCSANCLLEGSNKNYGSVCGNGRLEKGEGCEDGNTNNGDNCSSLCLVENNTNTGSQPNAPICGNGKVDAGEECDDGSGNASGNRCTTNCLLSGSGGVCGNGKLENRQFDSYSWTFTLADNAQICQAVNFDLNPCPNGVWSIKAGKDVNQLKVVFYKGSDSNTGNCISAAEMENLGFWRRLLRSVAKIIKSFFGFHSAIAADWWCPINSEADGQFLSDDLAKMRLGNFKRDINIDGVNTEVLAYTGDLDNYQINFIRSGNWQVNTQYRAVVNYERKGAAGSYNSSVTTYGNSCQMEKVRFDVWPRGATKLTDSFFCYSDPASGKLDDCGRFTENLYDDDMSAGWTMKQAGNGYNLKANGEAQTSIATDNYLAGNNHLYRVWPLDSHGFVLRGTAFNPVLTNINTKTTQSSVDSTKYQGDFWVTSGANPGRSIFNVTISDSADLAAGSYGGSLPIYTFFCNNPWPDPENFPFFDSSNNCRSGSGTCINTNFSTYYCRDAGLDKTCVRGDTNRLGKVCTSDNACYKNPPIDASGSCQAYTADDLPSIANYNAARKTFSSGTGVIFGNYGNTCATLPASFAIKIAFYNTSDNKAYLWGKDGSIYRGGFNFGWEKIDKGDWQKKGLPTNFNPIIGYSFNNKMYLWNNSGQVMVWDGNIWQTASKGNLPANFQPALGYVLRGAAAGYDIYIQLWDTIGRLYISDRLGNTWRQINTPPFKATIGYDFPTESSVQVWDGAGNIMVSTSENNWNTGNKTGLPSGFKPTVGFYDGSTIVIQQGNKTYRWENNSWKSVATTDKTCDNKLKEFLLTGTHETSLTTSSEAIGIRVYNNNNHYSPTYWYTSRFNPSEQGNLSKLSIDGYAGIEEGRTTYVNAADYSDDYSSLYTNMYLMSYSEGASAAMKNIYSQLVANWFFNAGAGGTGGLEYGAVLGYCSQGNSTEDNRCFSDLDCLKRNAGYCRSDKAKVTRDTQRLADIQDIYNILNKYYSQLRCSNDSARQCKTNADCYGGGVCGNFYPNLRAGTYLTGKTFSVWPSWQENLGKDLGATLPVDPVNKLWAYVDGQTVSCSNPFNQTTCWDQTSKELTNLNGVCNIDYSSAVYAYYGTKSGVSAKLYIKGEEYPTGDKWRPAWNLIANLKDSPYNPFDGYNALITSNSFCSTISDACGNGVCASGETCSNCPLDCGCNSGQSCQKVAGSWICGSLVACGDGIRQPGEECDLGSLNGPNSGCSTLCKLNNGYILNPLGIPMPVCGDGILKGSEQCEFINGTPTCGKITYNGQLCCTDQCQFANWYISSNKNPVCGDGIRTDNEACDCGTATILGTNNPFTCTRLNGVAPTVYSNNSQVDAPYCDINCRRYDKGQYLYCGDGQWTTVTNSPSVTFLDKPTTTGEVCDNQKDINCNSSCSGPKDQSGGCANGCCWAPGDGICNAACGEPATCGSDCAVCSASQACCNNSTCTWIVSAVDDDDVTKYCNENHLAVQNCNLIANSHPTTAGTCECNSGYVWNTLPTPHTKCIIPCTVANYSSASFPNLTLTAGQTNQSWTMPAECATAQPVTLNMSLAQPGVTKPEGVVVIFVTDLSGSMANNNDGPNGETRISMVNSFLPTAINDLMSKLPADINVRIGLVGFKYDPGSCILGFISSPNRKDHLVLYDRALNLLTTQTAEANSCWSDSQIINNTVNTIYNNISSNLANYYFINSNFTPLSSSFKLSANGGTPTVEGVSLSRLMINSPLNNNYKKILVILSDGAADDGYEPDTVLTQMKNTEGIEVYSAAIGEANLTAMQNWSSNSSIGISSCNNSAGSYCYFGNDISTIYQRITTDILDRLASDVKLTITIPGQNNQIIALKLGVPIQKVITPACGQTISFSATGLTAANQGQVTINGATVQYCKEALSNFINGQVAGVFESGRLLDNFWQFTRKIAWRLMLGNTLNLISNFLP